MSELKATSSGEIRTRDALLGYWWYKKSEADKVIAELKEGAKNLILDNYLKDKEIKHHKYNRCLAMAMFCHVSSVLCEGPDSLFYRRWFHKWHELAEKFKEAK